MNLRTQWRYGLAGLAFSSSGCAVDDRQPSVRPSEMPSINGSGGMTGEVLIAQGGSAGAVGGLAGSEGQVINPLQPGGGGSSGLPSEPLEPGQLPGGYFESGNWHGYVWLGADTEGLATFTPQSFDDVPAGGPFCFQGTVAGDPPSATSPGFRGGAQHGRSHV